jgi:hypothetical protein
MIIAISAQKGGVGKTSLTFHLSGAFAEAGYKTLLIDTDPQHSLSGTFLSDVYQSKNTLRELLTNPSLQASNVIQQTKFQDIHILPCNLSLGLEEIALLSDPDSQIIKILNLPQTILDEAEQTSVTKEHLLQLKKSEKPESTWQEIKHGKTAKEIKDKVGQDKPSKGRPRNFTYSIKPEGKHYKIIIQFGKAHAELKEIREALLETLNYLNETHLTDTTMEKPEPPSLKTILV